MWNIKQKIVVKPIWKTNVWFNFFIIFCNFCCLFGEIPNLIVPKVKTLSNPRLIILFHFIWYSNIYIYKRTDNVICRPFSKDGIITVYYGNVFHKSRFNISSPKMVHNYVVLNLLILLVKWDQEICNRVTYVIWTSMVNVGTILVDFIKRLENRLLLILKEPACIKCDIYEEWFIAVIMSHKFRHNL